jgi:two-component system OmpR family sensor kinase
MSLRLRLLLATGVVALVALIGADVVTYSSLRSYLFGQLDASMEQAHPPIEQCLDAGVKPALDLMQDDAPGMFLEERTPAGKVIGTVVPAVSITPNGGTTDALPNLPRSFSQLHPRRSAVPPGIAAGRDCGNAAPEGGGHTPVPAGTGEEGQLGGGQGAGGTQAALTRAHEQTAYLSTGPSKAGGPSYRIRASTLQNGNLLLLGLPTTGTDATLDRLLGIELAVTGGALLVALALGWWLVRVGMRPLVEVELTAEAISEGELGARIPDPRRPSTEIGRLARVLNTMLSRIERAFAERDRTERELRRSEERMRRFLGDASHELRTPLAAVSAYAELFERGAGQHPEDLPRILNGIRNETARMGQLVSDLLLLANLDEGRPLEQRSVELVSIASQAIDAGRAMGPGWPVRLLAERPVEVVGDGTRLRQVLDNLLSNVRSHTPEGTATEVVIREVSDDAVIDVVDHGPGLSDDGIARVFERFYRSEASRTRARGGTGLGLAIVRAIAEAHGGSVGASETDGGGATFSVRLPKVAGMAGAAEPPVL